MYLRINAKTSDGQLEMNYREVLGFKFNGWMDYSLPIREKIRYHIGDGRYAVVTEQRRPAAVVRSLRINLRTATDIMLGRIEAPSWLKSALTLSGWWDSERQQLARLLKEDGLLESKLQADKFRPSYLWVRAHSDAEEKVMDESNQAAAVKRLTEADPERQHWDCTNKGADSPYITVTPFDENGQVTAAGREILEIIGEVDDYPILDEEEHCERFQAAVDEKIKAAYEYVAYSLLRVTQPPMGWLSLDEVHNYVRNTVDENEDYLTPDGDYDDMVKDYIVNHTAVFASKETGMMYLRLASDETDWHERVALIVGHNGGTLPQWFQSDVVDTGLEAKARVIFAHTKEIQAARSYIVHFMTRYGKKPLAEALLTVAKDLAAGDESAKDLAFFVKKETASDVTPTTKYSLWDVYSYVREDLTIFCSAQAAANALENLVKDGNDLPTWDELWAVILPV